MIFLNDGNCIPMDEILEVVAKACAKSGKSEGAIIATFAKHVSDAFCENNNILAAAKFTEQATTELQPQPRERERSRERQQESNNLSQHLFDAAVESQCLWVVLPQKMLKFIAEDSKYTRHFPDTNAFRMIVDKFESWNGTVDRVVIPIRKCRHCYVFMKTIEDAYTIIKHFDRSYWMDERIFVKFNRNKYMMN
jgi:hypothetical protein